MTFMWPHFDERGQIYITLVEYIFFALSSETTIECYVSVAPIYHDSLVARYAQ